MEGAGFSVAHTASAGAVAFVTGPLLDGYGFENERVLLNASGARCDFSVDPMCTWRRVFGTWGSGYLGTVQVTGAPAADTNPCQGDTLTVTTTLLGVQTQLTTTGAIQ